MYIHTPTYIGLRGALARATILKIHDIALGDHFPAFPGTFGILPLTCIQTFFGTYIIKTFFVERW